MAIKIFGGTKPTGMLPIEYGGGLITQMSSSPREAGRLEVNDPATGEPVYKEVYALGPDVQITLQGGTPPGIGATMDVAQFGVQGGGGQYKVTGVGPAGNSGEFPSVTIYLEEFPS